MDNNDNVQDDQAPEPAPAPAPVVQDRLHDPAVLRAVEPFLRYADLARCREVSSEWNRFVLTSPRFQSVSKGKLTEKWYRSIEGMDLTNTFRWTQLQLTHFQYHRHSVPFMNYWHFAVSTTLTKLILVKCAFECDGFIFMLSHAANLDTLILNGCKLRDLDDIHSVQGRARVGAQCDHAPPQNQRPIQHLSIENMFKFEQCFFDYLFQRTNGQLKSLKISKCFLSSIVDQAIMVRNDRPSLQAMFMEFQRNILHLLRVNRGELNKFSFEQIAFQMHFFQALAAEENRDLLQEVPDLKLVLSPAEPTLGYIPFVQFMEIPRPAVKKLSLQIMGYMANETFNQAIASFKPTLEEFIFTFAGNQLGIQTQLDVSSVKEFQKLKRLVFRDSKVLGERDVRTVIGGRNRRRRNNPVEMRLNSNLNVNVFQNFPHAIPLEEISFEQCVFRVDNLALTIHMQAGPDGIIFCPLTKLQLRGPSLQQFDGLITGLVQYFPRLESLAITYCGIGDIELTGLDARAVFEIQRCLTIGLAVINAGGNPTADDIIQNVEQQVRFHGPANRSRLSGLKNLKHLDLSGNIGVSDISLLDSIRFEKLKSLELMSNNNVSDTGLEFLRVFCPALEEVNLKNCRRLSKYGLNRLISACKRLKRVYSTPMILERELAAFQYVISPNFSDVVNVAAVQAQTSGFKQPDDDFRYFALS